jgi:MFS transporter, FHS family, Na+ dependent glucose transporter 1
MNSQSLALALKAARSTDGRLSKTAAYYAAFIMLGAMMASLGPTLPGLAEHTQSRVGDMSFLFLARSFGFLLVALAGARLYDRLPGHLLVGGMLGLMAAAMASIPLISSLWLLTAVLLLGGMVESFVDIGCNTLIVWVYRSKVGPFMNGLHFCFGFGAFVAPLVVAWAMAMSGDINWAYWTLALLILPVAGWVLTLPNPTPQIQTSEEHADGVDWVLVGGLAVFMALYVGAEVGFGGWVFTYTITRQLADATVAAYLTSAFWGALTVGRLLSIPIATRLRPVTVLFCNLAVSLVSIGLIVFGSHSVLALWIGTLGLGLGLASTFPTVLSFSERRMTITGAVTGWIFAGASLGGMSLPWLIGQSLEWFGPQTMMSLILFDLLAAVVVLSGIVRYTR